MIVGDGRDCVLACAVTVEVTRFSKPVVVDGRKVGETPKKVFCIQAVVAPMAPRRLATLPEGIRTEGTKQVIAVDELLTAETSECSLPDQLQYKGVRYQVEQVGDYEDLVGVYDVVATRLDR